MEKILELLERIETSDVNEILKFDALKEAEAITGKSYKNDDETSSLGFLILQTISNKKLELLVSEKDTNYKTTIPELEEILKLENFEKIYSKEYVKIEKYTYGELVNGEYKSLPYENRSEMLIYWNYELNILITCTSYPSVRVDGDMIVYLPNTINSINMYYTIKSKDSDDKYKSYGAISSGGFNQNGTFTGNHDIREGFCSKLNKLKKYFNFVSWEGEQFFWLLHYSQTKVDGYNTDEINREVISHFPKEVQLAMSDKYHSAIPELKKIKEKMSYAFYGYHVNDMSQESIDEWFNLDMDPKMSLNKLNDIYVPQAWNKSKFIEYFKLYKEALNV